MVTDNLAKQISTSWGEAEDSDTNLNSYFQSENDAFMQMAAGTYAGHTLQIVFTGSENGTLQTSFVLDDLALAITE